LIRQLACTVLLLAVSASRAPAAQGLYLTWNECVGAASATADLGSACASDGGSQSLFCAFQLDQPADSVVAIEITLDVQHAAVSLPPWWRFDPGACRGELLHVNADFTARTDCDDFWGAAATKDPPVTYLPGVPGGLPSRARIFVSIALPPDQPVRLEAGRTYYAAEIEIPNAGTLACSGCTGGACLVLNSILIGRLTGAPGGNLLLATPGNPGVWATWQGGTGASCAAVPTVHTTWGRIKSLYR